MVEYTINLNAVFSSLADPTRRDIVMRVSKRAHSVGELAEAHKKLSFAAIAKHVAVLEEACLVIKKREGRYQIISVNPKALSQVTRVLKEYQDVWEARFNTLDKLLKT
jgi:DNA-binding transcriptional ArsR family regulator